MDEATYSLRNRTVGRNTSSSYRDITRIRPTPYPISANSSPTQVGETPCRRIKTRQRLSLSPPKKTLLNSSPTPSSDRFIPCSSSPVSLRHILSSPTHRPQRDGSQSPTNPQLLSPGKEPEWPNSYDDKIHSYRVASALEIPLCPKLLLFHSQPPSPTRSPAHSPPPSSALLSSLLDPPALLRRSQRKRIVPPDPFRILDAPELRDDYYAQPLSWCRNGTLAVALGMDIFLWSIEGGVSHLPSNNGAEDITSVTFSQTGNILAIAREDGSILLQSPTETLPRIHIAPISNGAIGALSWRPTTVPSMAPILHEHLVIGTFDGQVLLCEVTWNLEVFDAKVEKRGIWDKIHDDQICGIAWSNDGLSFATGANDNKVCTFEIPMGVIGVAPKWEKKFQWVHDAAVKALAYKSGKGGVLAAGGGVHDKKIRFYNTHHGTLISSLDVCAQITTLIWSPSTTEILATFGYTAPGTSTKCAVYAYPSLQCLFSFEIADETRALYAVPSPSGREICLAGSDECVRFYHIWGEGWGDRDTKEDKEKSPAREVVGAIDPQLQLLDRRSRLRSGLTVIR